MLCNEEMPRESEDWIVGGGKAKRISMECVSWSVRDSQWGIQARLTFPDLEEYFSWNIGMMTRMRGRFLMMILCDSGETADIIADWRL